MKKTKIAYLNEIVEVLKNSDATNAGEMMDFCRAEIETLTKKSEAAAKRAAAKRAENPDELKAAVAAALTKDWQTTNEIAAKIVPSESIPKIRPRLTALIADGVAEKMVEKDEEGHQTTMYRAL